MKQLLLIIGIALVPLCSIQAQESNEDIKKSLKSLLKIMTIQMST